MTTWNDTTPIFIHRTDEDNEEVLSSSPSSHIAPSTTNNDDVRLESQTTTDNDAAYNAEILFEFDSADRTDTEGELRKTISMMQEAVKVYLAERFSPNLQPNPFHNAALRELCVANEKAWKDSMTVIPSLDPRLRILRSFCMQASSRSEYLMDSLIVARLAKLFNSPLSFQPSYTDHDYVIPTCSSSTTSKGTDQYYNVRTHHMINSPNNDNISHDWANQIKVFEDIEFEIAEELQDLWQHYGIVEPCLDSKLNGRHITVHARTTEYGIPFSSELHQTDQRHMNEAYASLLRVCNTYFSEQHHNNVTENHHRQQASSTIPDARNDGISTSSQSLSIRTPNTFVPDSLQRDSINRTPPAMTSFNSRNLSATHEQALHIDSIGRIPQGTVLTTDYAILQHAIKIGLVELLG